MPGGSDQGVNEGHESVDDGFEFIDNANPPTTSNRSTTETGEDYSDEPSPMEADDSLKWFREEMIVSLSVYLSIRLYVSRDPTMSLIADITV